MPQSSIKRAISPPSALSNGAVKTVSLGAGRSHIMYNIEINSNTLIPAMAATDGGGIKTNNHLSDNLKIHENKQDLKSGTKSFHCYKVTHAQQYKYLPEELITALVINDKKQVMTLMKSFDIYNQEAIIELMSVLIEKNNIKMFKFLHEHVCLDMMQKKERKELPRFYCVFYAVVLVATEKNLPKIKKMLNKLFKFDFVPLYNLDANDFLSTCKQYSNFNKNTNLCKKVLELLENCPKKTISCIII